MLRVNHAKSMSEHDEIIANTVSTWKDSREQLDYMSIVGFKF
jgi:hypothetical protein